jgi:hypothetical protein
VCREDFKPMHAYLVAEALAEQSVPGLVLPEAAGEGGEAVPAHAGTRAFLRGEQPDAQ